MSIRTLAAIAAGGLVMTLAGAPLSPLYAQQSTSVEADAAIVREVYTRNLVELRLAEIARKKSTNSSVKSFAERMRTDHLAMHKQVTSLVGQNGQPYRVGLGKMETQLAEVKQIEKLSGSQFDQQYMSSMVRHHQDNVRYSQTMANAARSAQVRTLLANSLPVLQQHLSLAVQVGNQVGANTTVATGQNPTTQNPTTQYPAPQTQYPAPPTQTQPQTPTQYPVPAQSAPSAPAASETTPVSREDAKEFKKDSKFVREAMADATLEIRLAQVAQNKSTQNNVRQLAQWLQGEHTAMQNRWLSLASRNDMKLKPGFGPRHNDKVKRLEKLSSAEFDRAYLTMQIQNNQDYMEYFQKEGQATRSAQVRNQAAKDLTMIRQHLKEAKTLGAQMGVDTTAALKARNYSAYKNN